MALKDNSPTFRYISWKDLLITHENKTYQIQNSDTDKKYVYWDITDPYTLQCFDRTKNQYPGMYQLFINENGMATQRTHEDLIISWDGNNTDLIASQIFAIHETNKETGNKFVAIETNLNGINQSVGSIEGDIGMLIEDVSRVDQKANNIDLSVKQLTQEFSDNKDVTDLRENLNSSIIEYNSSLGVFKSETSNYFKDNVISSDEKVKVNAHLDVLDAAKTKVIQYTDVVIVMMTEEGQTSNVNKLNSAKTKFMNSVSTLRTYVSTAISDNNIVPSEIITITDLFAKCNIAISELKNVCDECIFLGSGGKISDELAKIGIKSDEILLSVSKTEELLKSNLSIEKSLLQGNITGFKNCIENLIGVLNTVALDTSVTIEESTLIENALSNVEIEKLDIDQKYNDLYGNVNISIGSKNTLKIEYDKFDGKFVDLKNKIYEVILDTFFNEAEKLQVDVLINELSSCLTNLHPVMVHSMDNIQLNINKAEIESAKNELQGNINDVVNRVNGLDDYINTTFENNILDESERKTIKSNLDALNREKVDIDNQYTQLNSNTFLDGILKTNYTAGYNSFLSKYNSLTGLINQILTKTELINNKDRDNMTNSYNQLNITIGTFVKLSNEVIEYIAKKEAEYIKGIIDQDVIEVDKKINDLTNNINTSFKDNVIDETERNLISANLKDLETQKIDVDNQFNQLILSIYLDGALKILFQEKYDNLVSKYNNLVKVMNDILVKQELINETDRVSLNNAKDIFNLAIGEFSRITNEVIEYIGKKQSESVVQDFSGQLTDLNNKVDGILGDIDGALQDNIIDETERIAIKQNLNIINNDFIENEAEYLKIYGNINLIGDIKTQLNTIFNTYKSKYQNLETTINNLLNKVGNIEIIDRDNLNIAYTEYGIALKNYISKLYESIESITSKGINDAKSELNKEIGDLSTSLSDLESTMTGVFKDGILSEAEKLSIKQHLQTVDLEKIDIDKSYVSAYNNVNLIGTPKVDLKNSYNVYILDHNNLVSVINEILIKIGILDGTDQAKLDTALSKYKISLSGYKIKYIEAIDSITSKNISDAKSEIQLEINDLNGALGDLESTMNNAFKDGILSDAEKLSMKQHLQTVANEKIDVDKQYTSVYSNVDLLGTAKSNLKSAYDGYVGKYNALVVVINNILNKVGLIDSTDQTNLNNSFSTYRTSSGLYSQRVNEAIDSIAKVKAESAEVNSKTYTESQVKTLNDSISLKVSQKDYDYNNTAVSEKFAEMTTKVDGFEFKMVESGGHNLLKNSAFKNGYNYWQGLRWDTQAGGDYSICTRNLGDEWSIANRNTLNASVVNLTGASSGKPLRAGFDSHTFTVRPNTTYTLNCLLAQHRVRNITIQMLCYDNEGNKITGNNEVTLTNIKGGGRDRNNWTKVVHTWTTQGEAVTCHLRAFMNEWTGESTSAFMWIGEPIVVEGDKDVIWTPNIDEIYTGIVSIDGDGVKVDMSDGEGTQGFSLTSSNGIEIFDSNSRRKAWFGDNDTAYIDKLKTNYIESNSVVKNGTANGRPGSWYVSPTATGDGTGRDINNKSNSINKVLNYIREVYGSYSYANNIYLYVSDGSYTEDVLISGFLGSGEIHVTFGSNVTLYGYIRVEECTMGVKLNGGRTGYGDNNGCILYIRNGAAAIHVRNSSVRVLGFRSRIVNYYTESFIIAEQGARVSGNYCDICGFNVMIHANQGSSVYITDFKGDVDKLISSSMSSIIVQGSMPMQNTGFIESDWGSNVIDRSTYQVNSQYIPKNITPPPTPTPVWKWFEQSFDLSNLRTVPEGSGVITSGKTGQIGQGKWGSYKSHRGYANVPSSLVSFCSGARNISMSLTMTRINTSHGYTGAVPIPKLIQSDGSVYNTGVAFARGDRKTISMGANITNTISSGAMGSLQMFSSTTNDYSFYENCVITVTCEKQV